MISCLARLWQRKKNRSREAREAADRILRRLPRKPRYSQRVLPP